MGKIRPLPSFEQNKNNREIVKDYKNDSNELN